MKKPSNITIQKDLVLKNTIEIKGALYEALTKSGSLKVSCKADINVDLAGIQLLLSLQNTAEGEQKEVVLELPFSKETWAVIERAGLHQLLMSIEK